MRNTPFNPDAVWQNTLKRFADLALAQAHEARTLQLRAISRPPLPLPIPSKTCTPRHLRRGSGTAELIFSDPLFYDYLVELNLERYTINRPKMEQQSTVQAIRKEYQKWIPQSKPNQE
jgi:hypothetical protein